MSVTISAWKRCLVRLYLQLFIWGIMSYLRYLCVYIVVSNTYCILFLLCFALITSRFTVRWRSTIYNCFPNNKIINKKDKIYFPSDLGNFINLWLIMLTFLVPCSQILFTLCFTLTVFSCIVWTKWIFTYLFRF